MFVVPAGTPKPIVDKLHTEMTAIITSPEIRENFVKAGRIPAQQKSVPEMEAQIKSELTRWSKIIQDAGLAGSQ
jgi:tripartite-type tricarboxylate transporter receptor subunit TctC